MAESNKPVYDVEMGGNVDVASNFSLKEFGAPRIEEILMLSEAINEPHAKGQLFQRLPKHMRRRQMSHHESRLPRKFRLAIESQIKDPPSKRPSRKYRRKPKNLLEEYNRRKRSKIWLETHIWHAKRFHLTDKWGYRLPQSSTNKGFRANYRAVKSHCLLIDISYMACLELTGDEEELKSKLKLCSSTACGLTFAARAYTEGLREGTLPMYHPNSYPLRVIGNVSFIWKPGSGSSRSVWLWTHPTFYQEVVECLVKVFELTKCDDEPKWASLRVTLTSLKDRLNRFRLVGPLSSSVLGDALAAAELPSLKNCIEVDESVMEVDQSVEASCNLLPRIYEQENWCESWKEQQQLALLLKNTEPGQFPTRAVFGLLTADPRISSPQQRIKSVPNAPGDYIRDWNINLAKSVIWEEEIRSFVSSNIPTDWQINQLKAEQAVPKIRSTSTAIPLLLVQQPGSRGPHHNGFAAGWDVIVPAGWGMAFWRSFVLRGARTGGLRETSLLRVESGSLSTALWPDSASGKQAAEESKLSRQQHYFRRPPAKRPNYLKLGIFEPFSTPWSTLGESGTFVIRDLNFLRRISEAIQKRKKLEYDEYPKGLIAIRLKCSKGRPEPLARIYVPESSDLKLSLLEEPVHDDKTLRSQRTAIRLKNKELLKQWRRDRKRVKNGEKSAWKEEDVEKLRKSSVVLMEQSWLPQEESSNLRKIVGFVTEADFSHSDSFGVALGYITVSALMNISNYALESKKTPLVLLRNVRHYRYQQASVDILLD